MKVLYLTNKNAENINELPEFIEATGDKVVLSTEKIDKKFKEHLCFLL